VSESGYSGHACASERSAAFDHPIRAPAQPRMHPPPSAAPSAPPPPPPPPHLHLHLLRSPCLGRKIERCLKLEEELLQLRHYVASLLLLVLAPAQGEGEEGGSLCNGNSTVSHGASTHGRARHAQSTHRTLAPSDFSQPSSLLTMQCSSNFLAFAASSTRAASVRRKLRLGSRPGGPGRLRIALRSCQQGQGQGQALRRVPEAQGGGRGAGVTCTRRAISGTSSSASPCASNQSSHDATRCV
jgi:hypothetical protein